MDSAVGPAFRATRTQHRLSIAQVANHLGVSEQYLAAIEDGSLDTFARPAMASAFVRMYARFLGYDSEPILAGAPPGAPDQKAPVTRLARTGGVPEARPTQPTDPRVMQPSERREPTPPRALDQQPFAAKTAAAPPAGAPRRRRRTGPLLLGVLALGIGAALAVVFATQPTLLEFGDAGVPVIGAGDSEAEGTSSEDDPADETADTPADTPTPETTPQPEPSPDSPDTDEPDAEPTEPEPDGDDPDEDEPEDEEEDLPTVSGDVTVQVLNGRPGDDTGPYEDFIAHLEDVGYDVVEGGPTVADFPGTRVLFTDGQEEAAEELTQLEPRLPENTESNTLGLTADTHLHVILGADWPGEENDEDPEDADTASTSPLAGIHG